MPLTRRTPISNASYPTGWDGSEFLAPSQNAVHEALQTIETTPGPQGDPGIQGPAGQPGEPGPQGNPGISAGRIFYFDPTTASDIAGYKALLESPSVDPESTIPVTLTGTSDVLMATFATAPGVPGAVEYPPGTGYRRIYARVSAGVARLHIQAFKRSAAGVETLVRDEFSPNFSNTTVALQEWIVSAPSGGAMATTDRIVVKLYAQRVSGTASFTVTAHFEGAYGSHIQTTIAAGGVGPAGPPGAVATGTFTPTTANVVNVASVTTYQSFWYQVLDRVTVSGRIDITPIAANLPTVFYMSLPVAFNVTAIEGLAGTAVAPGVGGQAAAIYGDVAGDRAIFSFVPSSTSPASWMFQYSYIAPTISVIAPALVSDLAYDATTWNTGITTAPSQHAVRDKLESLNLQFGTYTPTLANTTNVTTSSAVPCQYFRIGNCVVVSGLINLTPTAAAATDLDFSLPIASNMSTSGHLGGAASCHTPSIAGALFYGSIANKARLHFTAQAGGTNYTFPFVLMYQVI